MSDRKQVETSKIDALYSWISYDLQKMKGELMNEMKYSSVQMGSLYQEIKSDKDKSSQAISQEIRYSYKQNQTIYDGLAKMLTEEVGARLNAMDEKVGNLENTQAAIQQAVADVISKMDEVTSNVSDSVKEHVDKVLPQMEEAVNEIKYSYVQQQAIYDGLSTLIQSEVVARLDDAAAKLAMLEQIDATLNALQERLAEAIALYEENDYKAVIESVAEKTEESVAEHSRQVLEAVAAIPVAENVDYTRIVDEVGDKVLDLLGEIILPEPEEETEAKVDYDRIVYGTAEKVVESLPYPEKVDYRRIDDSFAKAAGSVQAQISEEALNAAVATMVEKAMASIDMEALAQSVADKVKVPEVKAPEIDYELLADMVAQRISIPEAPEAPEVDYDRLADLVAAKLAASEDEEEQTFDVVLDEAGIEQIAAKVSESLVRPEITDYDRIAAIVEDKLNEKPCAQPTYEFVVDEEGVQAIAKSVADELCAVCANCGVCEQPAVAEESAVEAVEEPVAQVAEETVEELAVAQLPLEEVVEETVEEDNKPKLVDVSNALVERLNKSFTAKLKQSGDKVKKYYSVIKNALVKYDRINSNISWNGDRFNYGRNTVAKMLIRGKTLCLLLDLDTESEKYPVDTYHQKNVGDQKAHEGTPFMVKITSDLASRKAVRLVDALAEEKGAVKDEKFETVDYVQEFAYEDDDALIEAGHIKKTMEKKVDFNF